jgi:hypothetical protein
MNDMCVKQWTPSYYPDIQLNTEEPHETQHSEPSIQPRSETHISHSQVYSINATLERPARHSESFSDFVILV